MVEALKSSVEKSMIAGLIFLTPVVAVALTMYWMYTGFSNLLSEQVLVFTGIVFADKLLTFLLVLLFAVMVVVVSGYVVRTFVGKKLESKLDYLFERIPLLGTVYDLAKTTSTDVFGEEKFKRPVRVKTGNMYRPAFKTGNETEDGRQVLFMPSSPNITSGYVIEVEPEDIEETNETVDQALEKLFTAGFSGYNR